MNNNNSGPRSSSQDATTGGPLYQQLRKLISIVDELRDVGLQQYINLPRITVLGSQSSGKSSVLESIVGIDLLPRGDGVVTRRPLEMRLNHLYENSPPWAVFDEIPGKKFHDFNEVKNNIIMLTDKIAGTSKNIVDKPIVLNVYSQTCPDLTLIDLPGITRIAIHGQDKNIEQITRSMAARYCSDPRTIILCVIPANQDMTISDGLQMAKDLDPRGIRTVGVITKIDIMDRGTNAKRMLSGQDVPLRLGYIGVKNRSQQDINDGMSVKEAIEREKMYFSTHPIYSTMPQTQLGTENLTARLTKVLFTHIKHNLPEITKEIRDKMRDIEDRLRDLGPPLPSESTEKMHLLWNMITDFVTIYKNTITGKFDSKRYQNSQSSGKKEISGGAKIKIHFYSLYKQFNNYNATNEYQDSDIEKAIMLHEGDTIPGFPSVDVFIYLIQPQLEKLREPALDLLQDVYHILEGIAQGIVERIFSRFPTMIPEVMDIITQVLQKERDKCREVVESVIDAEQNYLFTNDADYLANRTDIVPQDPGNNSQPNAQQPKGKRSNNLFVNEIRARIDSYFKLVVRNVRDTIPKTIGFFLVKASQERLQFALYEQINKNEALTRQLGEPERVTEERKSLNTTLSTLKNAIKILQRDPNITSSSMIGEDELQDELRQMQFEKQMNQDNSRQRTIQQNPNGGPGGQPPMNQSPNPNMMRGPPPQNMGPGGNIPPNMQQRPPSNLSNQGGMPIQGPPGGQPQGNPNPAKTGNLFGGDPLKNPQQR